MFWGNGDSGKLGPQERAELERLRRLVESGHIVALSPEQTAIALAAIKFYGNISATTGVLAGTRNVSIWIAGMIAVWWTSKDAVVEFVRSIVATGAGQ